MRKTDKAAEIAAEQYPIPDQWSTGDEDTWNGYKRKALARKIRKAINDAVRAKEAEYVLAKRVAKKGTNEKAK